MTRWRIRSLMLFSMPVLAWIGLAGLSGCQSDSTAPSQREAEKAPSATKVELTSPAFADGQPIPQTYAADGDDVSPPLAWSGLPEGTKELALICDDPDAPAGTWVHWVIYKIPADATGLPQGIAQEAELKEPVKALQGKNSWTSGQTIGYRGPAPPGGTHRYFFKLYALETPLVVDPGLDKASLLRAIEGHVLAEGQLMGTYQR